MFFFLIKAFSQKKFGFDKNGSPLMETNQKSDKTPFKAVSFKFRKTEMLLRSLEKFFLSGALLLLAVGMFLTSAFSRKVFLPGT
jgi:hypothetical protein